MSVDQLGSGLQGCCGADRLVRAMELFGWGGTVLPELMLLGCRVAPVVVLDEAVHAARQASGHGPQRDRDVLEIWEWPQSAGRAPAAPLTLRGILVRAGRWRCGLATAQTWRGFGPAAVLTGPAGLAGSAGLTGPDVLIGPAVVDETCRLEFQLSGVGLVRINAAGEPVLDVAAAAGRQLPARRRVLDRWIEETLYEHALATTCLLSKQSAEPSASTAGTAG